MVFMYLLVKTVVSLLSHTSKYDLATDIASVNNKVSVDLFCCMSSLFVVNMIHNLFISDFPLICCTRNNGYVKCLSLIHISVISAQTFFQSFGVMKSYSGKYKPLIG